MFLIYEISAAPHLPRLLNPAAGKVSATESRSCDLSPSVHDVADNDPAAHDNEIFVALTAS